MQSIYSTLSQIHGFHMSLKSILSLLLAQPYCIQKSLTRELNSSHHKTKQNETKILKIHKNTKEKKKEEVYI